MAQLRKRVHVPQARKGQRRGDISIKFVLRIIINKNASTDISIKFVLRTIINKKKTLQLEALTSKVWRDEDEIFGFG